MARLATPARGHISSRWQWLALNGAALGIWLFVVTQGNSSWSHWEEAFDPILASGKWGVRWLLMTLAMTPLHTFVHWRGAPKLRKSAGLWAFAFGVTHLALLTRETWASVPATQTKGLPLYWLAPPIEPYILLGMVTLLILSLLAATSNRWAMRRLGKLWKRLHRLVYAAGGLVLIHALLASGMSKRVMIRDPHAVTELQVYVAILALLLVVRVPHVRAGLVNVLARNKQAARSISRAVEMPLTPPVTARPTLPKLTAWPVMGMPPVTVEERDLAAVDPAAPDAVLSDSSDPAPAQVAMREAVR